MSRGAPRGHLPYLSLHPTLIDAYRESPRDQQEEPGNFILTHRTERGAIVGPVELAVVEKPLELLARDVGEAWKRGKTIDHGHGVGCSRSSTEPAAGSSPASWTIRSHASGVSVSRSRAANAGAAKSKIAAHAGRMREAGWVVRRIGGPSGAFPGAQSMFETIRANSRRMSVAVTIPTSLSFSTTGSAPIFFRAIMVAALAAGSSGVTVNTPRRMM